MIYVVHLLHHSRVRCENLTRVRRSLTSQIITVCVLICLHIYSHTMVQMVILLYAGVSLCLATKARYADAPDCGAHLGDIPFSYTDRAIAQSDLTKKGKMMTTAGNNKPVNVTGESTNKQQPNSRPRPRPRSKPQPVATAPVAKAPTAARTEAPTATSRLRNFGSASLNRGAAVIRKANAKRDTRGATKVVVHEGEIDTLEDIQQALTPAVAEHKRLADMFNEGRVITHEEVVHYNLLIKALDAIQRYVDEGDQRTQVVVRKYTDESISSLKQEVGASLAEIISQNIKTNGVLDQRIKKTNERIDRIDGGHFPWGATFIGLVLGFVAFVIWVSNAHFTDSKAVPNIGRFVFTYTVLNGPFGGILLGLLVFFVSIWIGTWFSRPTSQESVTVQGATYDVVQTPVVAGKTGTAPTRVLVPTSSRIEK
jgi:hypothetical protein